MPELPEVETVVQGLKPLVEGARIENIVLNRENLRFPFSPDFVGALRGRTFQLVSRRAKYLLFATDNPGTNLLAHLGMTGNFRFAVPDEAGRFERHDHVVFELSGSAGPSPYLVYSDPRRFGFMQLFEDPAANVHLKDLGPEPLGNAFSAIALAQRAKGKAQPVKSFLLDQHNVAGLGNIYVCEALWRARIAPATPAGALLTAKGAPTAKLDELIGHIRSVLTEAISSGGSTLQDYRNVDGSTGYFQHHFAVYDREGEPCERQGCRGTIRRAVQSGRSTFFCESCQKAPRARAS
ncbi:MAG: bifunctional DNA-formamidopyrimidine glycosylase/DNA-(apurinic or apyrimidinic site) lyase [Hyphomicrobiaceae bacterium]|nr:bifunctional DNA-formamidopyrimidine glycosylase/DNA-(apurinic or apyrimidinic site) lyase [Hyphomicrobiaceae bacterium]